MQRRLVVVLLSMLVACASATVYNWTIKPGGGGTYPSFVAAIQQLRTIANGPGIVDTYDIVADVGTYAEACTVNFATVDDGISRGYVVFRTDGSGYATITGGGSQRGIIVTGNLLETRRVTFQNIEVTGGSLNRIQVLRSRHVTFRNCLVSPGVGVINDAVYVENSPQLTLDSVAISAGAPLSFSILRVTGLAATRSDSLYARHLTVTGGTAQYGINLDNAWNCRFDTVAVSAGATTAFRMLTGRVAFINGGSITGTHSTYGLQVSGYDSVIVSGLTVDLTGASSTTALRFDGSDTCVVRQSSITGSPTLGTGIHFNTSIDCRIDSCNLTNISGTGLRLQGTNNTHKRGSITGCSVSGPIASNGILVEMDSVRIDSCAVTVNSNPTSAGTLANITLPAGVGMVGGSTLRKCSFTTAGDFRTNYGIQVVRAPRVRIDSCVINLPSATYPPVCGILDSLGSRAIRITGCQVTGFFSREGILIAVNGDSAVIDSCQVTFTNTRSTAYGIRLVGTAGSETDSCTVRKTTVATVGGGPTLGYGFGVDRARFCRFDTCSASNISNTGFVLTNSSFRARLTGCGISGPFTTAGISTNASDTLVVDSCNIQCTTTGGTIAGVLATGSNRMTVRRTTINASGTNTIGFGVNVTGAANGCRVDSCVISNVTNTGIRFAGASGANPAKNGRVTGCSVSGPFTIAGIAAADYADTLTIDSCSVTTTANIAGPNAIVRAYRSPGLRIRKTSLTSTGSSLYAGINFHLSAACRIDTCVITTPGGSPSFGILDTLNSNNTQVNGCNIIHSGSALQRGVFVANSSGVTVRDVVSTGSNGINTAVFEGLNSNGLTFQRCSTYANSVHKGVQLDGCNYSKVYDLRVPQCYTVGVRLVRSDFCGIRNCHVGFVIPQTPLQSILVDSSSYDTVAACRIAGNGNVALKFYNPSGASGIGHYIANNMVHGWGNITAGSAVGIELTNQTGPTLYYNTVFGPDSSNSNQTQAYNVKLTSATGVKSRNNIFVNQGEPGTASATSACYFVSTGIPPSSFTISNNNCFWSSGAIATNGSSQQWLTLTDWRGSPGNPDTNSIEADPLLVDASQPQPFDLHILAGSPCRWKGAPLSDVSTDFDGDVRGSVHPCIGADEFVATDVQPLAILAPTGEVDSGTVVTPQCRVASFSNTAQTYNIRMRIGGDYDSTFTVTNHVEGETLTVTFASPEDDWTALVRGNHAVLCTTELVGDNSGTNRVTGTVFVRAHDAAAEAILAPASNSVFAPGVQVTPQAQVRNNSNVTENIPVTFTLTGATGYSNSQTADNIAPGALGTVSFVQSPALDPGYYTMTCATELVPDGNPANNTVSGNFLVIGVPTLIYPVGIMVNTAQPAFDWDDLAGATSYVLQAATDPGFSNIVCTEYPTGSTVVPGTPLPEGDIYWRVRGVNVLEGSWSTTGHFGVDLGLPDAPNLLQPPSNAMNVPVTPTFEWTSVSYDGRQNLVASRPSKKQPIDAITYRIQVADNVSFNNPIVDTTTLNTTLVSPVTLANFVKYYWRVNATDDANNTGPWGGPDSFTTIITVPDVPQLVAPENGAVNVAVVGNLEWAEANLADEYDVYLDTVNPPAQLLQSGVTVPTMVPYSGLENDRTYYWQVVAKNVAGTTPSAVWNFRTIVAVPNAPLLIAPPDTAREVPLNGELVWHRAPRAASYDVYFDTLNPPVALAGTGLTDTSLAYSGLRRLTTYYWCVVARNVAGESASTVWSFTSVRPVAGGWTSFDTMTGGPVRDGGGITYNADKGLMYAIKGGKTNEFWQYNPVETTWTKLTDVTAGTKPVNKGAAITTGGGFVYVLKGNNTYDFYKYDIEAGTWAACKPLPKALDQTATRGKAAKGGGSLAYVYTRESSFVYTLKGSGTNEFYRYDVLRDTFFSLAPAPYNTKPKYDKGSWIAYDGSQFIYLMQNKYNALFKYDVVNEAWVTTPTLDPMPLNSTVTGKNNKKVGDGSCAAFNPDGGYLFAMKGNNTQEAWKYLPGTSDTWVELESIPQAYPGGKKKKVKAGAGAVYYPEAGVFYVQKGNKSNQFWRYTPGIGGPYYAGRPQREGIAVSGVTNLTHSLAIAPNPLAGGQAVVRYTLPRAGLVSLSVCDVTGRVVMERTFAAGRTGVQSLDLRGLSAGVYLVKLNADGFTSSQKLVVER